MKHGDIEGQGVVGVAGAAGTPNVNTIYKDNIIGGWVNFNGTGTIAIRDSFNVTSITDNGTGNTTVTWDTDFANANYSVASMPGNLGGMIYGVSTGTWLAGSVKITSMTHAGVAFDTEINSIIAIGDQ